VEAILRQIRRVKNSGDAQVISPSRGFHYIRSCYDKVTLSLSGDISVSLQEKEEQPALPGLAIPPRRDFFEYQVNMVVDNSERKAPSSLKTPATETSSERLAGGLDRGLEDRLLPNQARASSGPMAATSSSTRWMPDGALGARGEKNVKTGD
jgi:hypothetical protein